LLIKDKTVKLPLLESFRLEGAKERLQYLLRWNPLTASGLWDKGAHVTLLVVQQMNLNPSPLATFISFLFAAVIHMLGGFTGFMGAWLVGPRMVSGRC